MARGVRNINLGNAILSNENKQNSAEEEAVARMLQIPETVRSPLHRNIYCNHLKVPISQWDMGLVFGALIEGENGKMQIQDEVTIKMSPQYFKAAVTAMSTSLQEWEKIFGTIPMGLGQAANTSGLEEAFSALEKNLTSAAHLVGKAKKPAS